MLSLLPTIVVHTCSVANVMQCFWSHHLQCTNVQKIGGIRMLASPDLVVPPKNFLSYEENLSSMRISQYASSVSTVMSVNHAAPYVSVYYISLASPNPNFKPNF